MHCLLAFTTFSNQHPQTNNSISCSLLFPGTNPNCCSAIVTSFLILESINYYSLPQFSSMTHQLDPPVISTLSDVDALSPCTIKSINYYFLPHFHNMTHQLHPPVISTLPDVDAFSPCTMEQARFSSIHLVSSLLARV